MSEQRHKFTVEADGKTFDCERVVSGTLKFSQVIYVESVGGKPDTGAYGTGDLLSPVETMPGVARLIAREIIREAA